MLLPVGLALGWNPGGRQPPPSVAGALGAILLGSAAFAGIGLLMAGTLRAEVNLAAANGLYLVLLLLGGMIVPLAKLPGGLASLRQAAPGRGALDGAARHPRAPAVRCPPNRGSCSRSGPWPPRWRPRSRSAGNEGPLVGGERRRREHAPQRRSWLMVPSPLTNTA